MAQQIQLRRDTAAEWTSVDPVLAQGEVGVETDTNRSKIGDGVTAWTSLPYHNASAATLVDAKGDLLVGTANDTLARVGVGTNGQVLTADSAEAAGVKWAAAAGGGGDPPSLNMASSTVGHYISPAGADGQIGTGSFVGRYQNLYLFPFFMPVAATIDRIAIEVTTSGTGDLRLGLYQAGVVSGGVATLIVDAGTVDPSSTGLKEATISATTLAQGWTLFGIVWQTTNTTAPQIRTKSGVLGVISSRDATPLNMLSFASNALVVGSTTGALPASPTAGNAGGLSTGAGNPAMPSLAFRRA
jgi:hypothetical protein